MLANASQSERFEEVRIWGGAMSLLDQWKTEEGPGNLSDNNHYC